MSLPSISAKESLSRTSTPKQTPPSSVATTADDDEIRQILAERENASTHRLRDLVFTKQFTTFDRQNPLSAESPFRGFFTLFWLAIALMLLKVAASNYKVYGSVVGKAEMLHFMFDRDVIILGLTDGVMVGSTVVGLGLQKAVAKEWISWRRTGWIIQNLWQTAFLFSILAWTWYREWPWTHTIFMVMHTLTFVMKQHSYAFYNGYLSQLNRRKRLLERKLEHLRSTESSDEAPSPVVDVLRASGVENTQEPNGQIQRRPPLNSRTLTDPTKENSHLSAVVTAIDDETSVNDDAKSEFTTAIENELAALTKELHGKTTNPEKQYPNNLTLANWADYTIIPTLCYELEYPRQKHINWWYVAEKSAAALGGIFVMIVVSQAYIHPVVLSTLAMKDDRIATRWREFPWVVSDLLFPVMLEQLLTWWVVWECVLNVLAEVTGFADRNFYGTWWNSVSFDEYARDWNRPVHNFLLRHVYNSSISSFHVSRTTATLVTFTLSALVHELLMFCMFKKVRGYLFTFQLFQIPLAWLSRTKVLKDRKTLGNLMFWFGLFIGPSILGSLYLIV
ncbi:acyl-CoA/sterol acyltransferase [Microthyrium microscopicum]|uniref:O-acyltransferase n=1 Tax=Microthyrium microscopicum TaxID=703497 RepID=A0A6A6TWS9_9PEZI|nr:acyl-CoA/sterol acyltransferase [Microthyrium microscopicum]